MILEASARGTSGTCGQARLRSSVGLSLLFARHKFQARYRAFSSGSSSGSRISSTAPNRILNQRGAGGGAGAAAGTGSRKAGGSSIAAESSGDAKVIDAGGAGFCGTGAHCVAAVSRTSCWIVALRRSKDFGVTVGGTAAVPWDQAGEASAAASNIHAREIMMASVVWRAWAGKPDATRLRN